MPQPLGRDRSGAELRGARRAACHRRARLLATSAATRSSAGSSSGIAETVTNDLRATSPLRVIDRVRVVEAVRRCGSRSLGACAPSCTSICAVVGSFQRAGDAAAHHRARRRCRHRRSAGRRQGGRPARPSLRSAGPHRRAVRRGARHGAARREPRRRIGDTSSLEAYQAFTEGACAARVARRVAVPAAIADFERAIELDPRYAPRTSAWQTRGSGSTRCRARATSRTAALLARAIDHVRRAIELERDLAEAHATLSFLLMSAGRAAEALTAARRAVALEPGYWGQPVPARARRLGRRAPAWRWRGHVELYPDFPFVHFEAAMVHIARGDLDRAESVLREGTIVQDRQADLQAAVSGERPALAARAGPARARRRRRSAARVRARDRVGTVAALRSRVRDERARRRRLRLPATGDARPAADAVPQRAGAVSRARALARRLGAALAAAGDKPAARAAFDKRAAAIDALRRGGRGERSHASRGDASTPSGTRREGHRRLDRCSSRPTCPSSGGPSRSSRCSSPCAACPTTRKSPPGSPSGRANGCRWKLQ